MEQQQLLRRSHVLNVSLTRCPVLVQPHSHRKLPILERHWRGPIRCNEGGAVLTGPGDYGDLNVRYVIHAVGPNYNEYDEEEYEESDRKLQSAYQSALKVAHQAGIEQVGFSLLSAGIFKGMRSLEDVLELAVKSIMSWGREAPQDCAVKEVVIFAFTPGETNLLKKICNRKFGIADDDDDDDDEKQVSSPEAMNISADRLKMDVSVEDADAAPSDEEKETIIFKSIADDAVPSDEEEADKDRDSVAANDDQKDAEAVKSAPVEEESKPLAAIGTKKKDLSAPVENTKSSEQADAEMSNKKIKVEASTATTSTQVASDKVDDVVNKTEATPSDKGESENVVPDKVSIREDVVLASQSVVNDAATSKKEKSNSSPSNLARAIDAIPKESKEDNTNETGDKKLDTEETKKIDGTEKTGVDLFK